MKIIQKLTLTLVSSPTALRILRREDSGYSKEWQPDVYYPA